MYLATHTKYVYCQPGVEADDEEIISVADNSKGKVTGVDFSGNIPKVFYQDIPSSPTASDVEPPKEKPSWLVGMLKINKTYEPNPSILQEQWTHPDNQSNLADGPVYFNCYPNFSVDINDPNVIDSLTLNVKTKNLNSKINTREIAIIYRVYYRLMKTHLAPKARHTSIRGETMLMEANHEHSSIFVPRTLQWKDILSSNDWYLIHKE
ncbi:hypothetical protein KY285_026332 [Solanum tuberosum]|nr:hypothetical protein KY285_026332 [Solanum tuberosum]